MKQVILKTTSWKKLMDGENNCEMQPSMTISLFLSVSLGLLLIESVQRNE